MAQALDFESEFLEHSASSKGSGYLKNWKEDGSIIVWVHPTAPIYSLWSHGWRRADTRRGDDNNPLAELRGMRVNCLEAETVLKKQRFRNDDGSREMPPRICPHCLMVEWVRTEIEEGRLDWCDPIFEFGSGEQTETIYAGGFCGLFQKKNLSEDAKKSIRERTGIKFNEVFLQNGSARQQYVFGVLADNELDAGWVIAIESQTLGDKLKKEIRDQVKRCKGDMHKGHPRYNPYPFEWSYDENKDFSDKYDVVAMTGDHPDDRVEQLLKSEPPDMSSIVAPPRLGTMHDLYKNAALIDMPFDSFFESAVEKHGFEHESSQDDDDGVDDESLPSSNSSATVEEEPIGCDVCEKPMAPDDMKCKHCGAEYGENDDSDVVLLYRRCGNDDCLETKVPVEADGTGTCPQCGAVHSDDWSFELPKVEEKPKRSRQSRRATRRAASSK